MAKLFNFGFFGTSEHRVFNYKPRYYDPEEEKRRQLFGDVDGTNEKARESAASLEGKRITIKARVGENGKLFGAITAKEIVQALKEQQGIEIDRKKIAIDPIKMTGEYTAKASLFENVSTTFTVVVTE